VNPLPDPALNVFHDSNRVNVKHPAKSDQSVETRNRSKKERRLKAGVTVMLKKSR
jgi:hypothetical protein